MGSEVGPGEIGYRDGTVAPRRFYNGPNIDRLFKTGYRHASFKLGKVFALIVSNPALRTFLG